MNTYVYSLIAFKRTGLITPNLFCHYTAAVLGPCIRDLARISWSSFKVINKLNTGDPNPAFETI